MKKLPLSELKSLAQLFRTQVLKMVHGANSGHFGGPFSCIDMLTVLYFYAMNIDPKNPKMANRDRFVLSVGHVCAGLYAVLSKRGFFAEELLYSFRKLGSPLQGHPKFNLDLGIEMSTGSLGQGMSVANGMALAAKLNNQDYRVYSLESDGGAQEGMMWEGAMTAAHYKLDNRCALLDFNNVQIDGHVENIKGVEPLDMKFQSFGWHVIKIDGHDFEQICGALDEARAVKGQPTVIIGKTVLGKGVSIFENKPKYHGVPPTVAELEIALAELTRNV